MTHKLYTDGSHQVAVDIAGIGGLLLDSNNLEVWRFTQEIKDNKPQHELQALEYALLKCVASGVRDVVCHSDSKRTMQILSHGKKATTHTSTSGLVNSILDLRDNFDSIDFVYMPRDKNKIADKLAGKILASATKLESRANMVQKNNPEKEFFSAPNLHCTEKFISKTQYAKERDKIVHYYLFDLNDTQEGSMLDIYSAEKKGSISHRHIGQFKMQNKWVNLLEHIALTISSSTHKDIALILPSECIVNKMFRGMMPLNEKLVKSFEKVKEALQHVESVYLESQGTVYSHIFPPRNTLHFKTNEEKIEFMIDSMKQLGNNYQIGQNKDIENYFELQPSRQNNPEHIQKKYLGEFMKMMATLGQTLPHESVKKDLQQKGVHFTF